MNRLDIYAVFSEQTSLKESSKDKEHKTYMTMSEINVVDFDSVKSRYVKANVIRETKMFGGVKSNDALFQSEDGKLVFIEFKNGKIDTPLKAFELAQKIYDSVLIFNDEVNTTIGYTRKQMDYILVYNEEKNSKVQVEKSKTHVQDSSSFNNLVTGMLSLGCGKYYRFDLEKFENYFFKNVFAYTKEEFEKEFVKKYEKPMLIVKS